MQRPLVVVIAERFGGIANIRRVTADFFDIIAVLVHLIDRRPHLMVGRRQEAETWDPAKRLQQDRNLRHFIGHGITSRNFMNRGIAGIKVLELARNKRGSQRQLT